MEETVKLLFYAIKIWFLVIARNCKISHCFIPSDEDLVSVIGRNSNFYDFVIPCDEDLFGFGNWKKR